MLLSLYDFRRETTIFYYFFFIKYLYKVDVRNKNHFVSADSQRIKHLGVFVWKCKDLNRNVILPKSNFIFYVSPLFWRVPRDCRPLRLSPASSWGWWPLLDRKFWKNRRPFVVQRGQWKGQRPNQPSIEGDDDILKGKISQQSD